jgi:hypothetical protein
MRKKRAGKALFKSSTKEVAFLSRIPSDRCRTSKPLDGQGALALIKTYTTKSQSRRVYTSEALISSLSNSRQAS